jgi:hypothetical protein
MAIAIILAFLFLGGMCFFGYKYLTIKKLIKKFQNIGTGRYGFYEKKSISYNAYVYVDEIDRYKTFGIFKKK